MMYKLLLFSSLTLALSCGDTEKSTDNGPGWSFGSTMLEPEPNNGVADVGMDLDIEDQKSDVPTGDPQINGEPCDDSTICGGGTCFANFPDGYCSEIACDGVCELNGKCVEFEGDELCAADCGNDSDCREGYICTEDNVCLPGERVVAGAPDGEGCAQDADCTGGTCITEWPGGFCTTVGCDTFEDCARGDGDLNNRCFQQQDQNFCARICTSNDECREDYVCQPISRSQGICVPDPATPIDPNVIANLAFDLTCVAPAANGLIQYDYTIAADTTAYQITPLNIDGKDLQPRAIELPDGAIIDFGGRNSFQGVGAQLYGGMNPTVVPAIPQFTADLQSGVHTYGLATASDETCFFQVEETAPGTVIDLNIHLVGVQGVNAASAPNDVNMQESLTAFSAIYAAAGLTIGKITYTDITGTAETRFSVVRSEADLSELVALSKPVGPTVDDALTMNVFFVRSFALGDAIGISLGLPGPAGLHGTAGSGVAFTTEFLGQQVQGQNGAVNGNDLTAQVLAHEIGHYLGLFHTTEQSGQHDPLDDTPECQQISLNCPDLNNLMFPFAGKDHTIVTQAQSFVLGVHPLTKTVTP